VQRSQLLKVFPTFTSFLISHDIKMFFRKTILIAVNCMQKVATIETVLTKIHEVVKVAENITLDPLYPT